MGEKAFIFICLAGLLVVVPADLVHVTTNYGILRGDVDTFEMHSFSRFRGVPYAVPPVGDLRFKLPVSYPKWSGIRNATNYGNPCLQQSVPILAGDSSAESEDCLFLNIFVPADLNNSTQRNNSFPVMFWIHGGGYQSGTASQYGGEFLAVYGKVIVVTINYRLGMLGFLSTRTKEAPGNVGLHDMRMALKWVRDNIKHFSGDESKITIFGESAGGHAVNLLKLSPLTKGLYTRAISQSGTVFSPWGFQNHPVDQAKTVGEKLGCSTVSMDAMVHCLRGVSARQLYDSFSQEAMAPSNLSMPSVDGTFIPYDPVTLMESGRVNPGEYMTGSNSLEGYLFENLTFFGPEFGITYEKNTEIAISHPRYKNSDMIMEGIRLTYGAAEQNFSVENRDTFLDMYGDLQFVAPSERAARLHSQTGHKTFSYMFSHALSTLTPKRGATHGEEIAYIFGYVSYLLPNVTEEEKELGRTMMEAWVSFAKTGDPGWVPYDEQSRRYLDFDAPVSNMTTVKSNLWPRRMAFWNDVVPAIENETPCNSRPVIETTYGKIRGARKTKDGVTWEEYLGIPYAAPPVGNRRFRPPEDVATWPGIREASKYGAHCPQAQSLLDLMAASGIVSDAVTSEDCLTLNVFVPRGAGPARQDPLPVMVWIHGGAFSLLSAEPYEGHILATHGNIILVKINYRLGALGFFATGDSEYPGNYGLMDQLAALRWVNKNVHLFGGNPDKVTIFGASAGGSSVSLLAVSPASQGLFHRAVSMGGVAMNMRYRRHRQISISTKLAEKLRCPTVHVKSMMSCLQQKSKSAIISDSTDASAGLSFAPIIDGKIVLDNPQNRYLERKSPNIDFLVGFTNGELDGIPLNYMSERNYSLEVWNDFKKLLKNRASARNLNPDALVAAAISHYFPTIPISSEEFIKGAGELLSDWFLGAPAVDITSLQSKAGGKSHLYVFSQALSGRQNPAYIGAPHSETSQFVFGAPLPPFHFTQAERELSQKIMTYWTNFAKTGDPNKGDSVSVQWPQYDIHRRQYIDFTIAMNASSVKANYKENNMRLWNKVVKVIKTPCEEIPIKTAELTSTPSALPMSTSSSWVTPNSKDTCALEIASGLRVTSRGAGAAIWSLTGGATALLIIIVLLLGWGCKLRQQLKKMARVAAVDNHEMTNQAITS